MRIGVDLDGVLTNMEEYQLKYGKKYFKKSDDEIDVTAIDIKDIFKVSKSEREKFWTKYIWKYCLIEAPKMNSVATLKKLKEEGHSIHIITGRAHTTETGKLGDIFRKMVFMWLKKNDIPYDTIDFCKEDGSEEDKLRICKKLNIDVMIDDKTENNIAISKIAKVLCFNALYNQNCEGNNIVRVYNFNQVYDEIKKMTDKDYFQKKSNEEIEKMSHDEQIDYYNRLREYIKNLPFDEKNHSEKEKNYVKLCKTTSPIFKLLFNPKAFNRNLVPNENGILFVANHNNYYDQFPIITALGDNRPIHFLTATKMLKMKRGKVYINTGAISVDREDAHDRENSSLEVKKLLLNKKNVFIFPEGRTNRNESFLLDFKPGAMAIARDTGCTVVPIGVNDTYKKKNGRLCVRFGEPFNVSPCDDIIEKTEELKSKIAVLKRENIEYNEKRNK